MTEEEYDKLRKLAAARNLGSAPVAEENPQGLVGLISKIKNLSAPSPEVKDPASEINKFVQLKGAQGLASRQEMPRPMEEEELNLEPFYRENPTEEQLRAQAKLDAMKRLINQKNPQFNK